MKPNSPLSLCWGAFFVTMLLLVLMYLLKCLHVYGLLPFLPMADDSVSPSRRKNRRMATKIEAKAEGRKNDPNVERKQQDQRPKLKKSVSKVLAMDCEMVGVRRGNVSILARVSIVDSGGQCLYDTFVKPSEAVVDYRTRVSGVRPDDLRTGVSFREAQRKVIELLKDAILVGHDLRHDFKVLHIKHPKGKVRDTTLYQPFRDLVEGNTPSLKTLAKLILREDIHRGEHSSIQDARIAMRIYQAHKHNWERLYKD